MTQMRVTSVELHKKLGQTIDAAQREPVVVINTTGRTSSSYPPPTSNSCSALSGARASPAA